MPESTVTRRAKSAAQSANGGDRPAKARRRAKETVEEPQSAVENVRDTAEEETESATDTVKGAGSSGGGGSIREELTSIVREAALEVLKPVARKATLQAAKYAITQGPQLAGQNLPRLRDAVDDAGGLGPAARRISTALPERGRAALEGRGIGKRKGESRKLPLQMSIDIAAPQDIVYEELSERVAEMGAFRDGDIVDEERGVRLDWEGDSAATAVITMHSLAEDLTRVMVSYETGTGGLRGALSGGGMLIARSLRSDLRRLKADLEMGEPEEADEEPPESESESESREEEAPRGRAKRSSKRSASSQEDEEDDARDTRAEDERDEPRGEADEEDTGDEDTGDDEDTESETTRRAPVRRRAPARKRQTPRETSRR